MQYRFLIRYGALLGVLMCAAGFLCGRRAAGLTPQRTSATDATAKAAAELLEKALAAEAAGNLDRRAVYLREALDLAPDYAPIHWQLGEIRVDDAWLSVDAASQARRREGKVSQYRELRDAAKMTVDDQLKLARWCNRMGLTAQERAHLARALDMNPSKKQAHEAVAKLNLVRYRGRLMSAAEAEALNQQARRAEADYKSWMPRLTRLRHGLESRNPELRKSAEAQLSAIRDVAAVPALEAVFAKSAPATAEVAIRTLELMPQQPATDSLMRQAVLPEDDEVRQRAAETLGDRDIFTYAPQLVESLVMPLEVSFDEATDLVGGFRERLTLFREGPRFNLSFVSNHIVPGATTASLNARPGRIADALREATRVMDQAEEDRVLAAQAAAENKITKQRNDRIVAALQTATGQDLPNDPKAWWSWWDDYNELHYPRAKPTYESVRTISPRPSHSCFVPGTKVWTEIGPLAIEKVRIGDAVLSQDVETGELSYKPVSATTAGPPLPLVELRAGGETIRCTYGHLFWVSGTGWQMAKELRAGQRLYTARGPLSIEQVDKRGEASCHNLIVADFNTYFVADQQVLVHDINVRRPTSATVPGMMAP